MGIGGFDEWTPQMFKIELLGKDAAQEKNEFDFISYSFGTLTDCIDCCLTLTDCEGFTEGLKYTLHCDRILYWLFKNILILRKPCVYYDNIIDLNAHLNCLLSLAI